MTRILSVLRRLSAAAVLIIAGLLCWQCIDIYVVGNMPQNLNANGVHLTSVFCMEDVAARFRALAVPLCLCMLIIIATILLHLVAGKTPDHANARKHAMAITAHPAEFANTKTYRLRVILLILAIVFILLGVMNGGIRDVLVKAINICTECIGLG